MSATIKRYDINHNGLDCNYQPRAVMEPESLGDYVLHADHLASHAYDEAKERALFEAVTRKEWPGAPLEYKRDALPKDDPRYGEYCDPVLEGAWSGWSACAKSRAKAAGCE